MSVQSNLYYTLVSSTKIYYYIQFNTYECIAQDTTHSYVCKGASYCTEQPVINDFNIIPLHIIIYDVHCATCLKKIPIYVKNVNYAYTHDSYVCMYT